MQLSLATKIALLALIVADLMQTARSQARLMEAVALGRRLENLQTDFLQRIIAAGRPSP